MTPVSAQQTGSPASNSSSDRATAAAVQTLPIVTIDVLSNRPDLVSGGDALVEVNGADPATVASVDVDGRYVTSSFALRPNGRFQGMLTGLKVGANVVTVRRKDGSGARITIDNHPIGGPVFSGAQTQPWLCRTVEAGLGAALDAQCNVPSKVSYLYKSTDPSKLGLQPYDTAHPPLDVAMANTDHAGPVPFIVRLERGVIDRGVYEYLVLADPRQPWQPWQPQKSWNGKLYWSFGGDCKPNHVQPAPLTGMTDVTGGNARLEAVLARGFATAASGLTNLGSDCNSVVSAEAVMMIKERIVETLGPIRYTMSEGASGGSMQQHWHVSNYPGLLNGIQPSASYPDIWQTLKEAEDCHLLNRYFQQASPHLWLVTAQQDAVTGYAAPTVCAGLWANPVPGVGYAQTWLDPDNAPGCGLPAELVYNALTNPRGVRCTLQDYMGSVFGYRSSDGFAHYPYDNTGVQYGLVALNSLQITPEQFVDLNEKVGGLDVDWNHRPRRSEADLAAIQTMYRAGLVTSGAEADKVPIIDLRGTSNYEIHTDIHSYSMRARLQKANGHADNQVIWSSIPPLAPDADATDGSVLSTPESFALLDTWLSRIEADTSDVTLEEKVRRNKPATAVDACWIAGVKITDMQKCRAAFPFYATPRMAAGGPVADDIVKCQLKPLDRSDYQVQFSDEQWQRLLKAFPDGVCDYSKPGIGEQPSSPWMSFADGPGGRPLGDPPRSVSLSKSQR
jgi:hypothetical protein